MELSEIATANESDWKRDGHPHIRCTGVAVKWPAATAKESEKITLDDITFNVQSGQVLAVVGHVGSGKVGNLLRNILQNKNYFVLFFLRVPS